MIPVSVLISPYSYFIADFLRLLCMRFWLIILGCMGIVGLSAQTLSRQEIRSINQEILFVNESIHGSLVLHRVYEGYNQDINKYVDLPSYQLNNYGNSDLPADIFEDPDRWFYQVSPNTLYGAVERESTDPIKTSSNVRSIKSVTQKINADRVSIEKTIKNEDMNQLKVIQSVYSRFEEVIGYYKSLESNVKAYELKVSKAMFNNDLPEKEKQVYTAFGEIHLDIKKAIRLVGSDSQSGIIRLLPKIEKERNWLMACISELDNAQYRSRLIEIFDQVDQIVKGLGEYLNAPKVPDEYSIFGKGYYYKNVVLLTALNRYGNGYVSTLNEFFRQANWEVIHFIEEPHFLKIIYPETTPKDLLAQPIEKIETLEQLRAQIQEEKQAPPPPPPKEDTFFKGRNKADEEIKEDSTLTESSVIENPKIETPLKIVNTHTIYVDSLSFDIELYDHLIKDGDRVSINVNGEWVYNDISLEKETKKIRLNISADKENFIMVQAVNTGWRPPNTVGLRYRSGGKVENMLLKTDLNSAELVHIKYRIN